jgi:hypothetical protein
MMVHRKIHRVSDTRVPVIHRDEISAMIADSVATQVEEEMIEWGSKPRVAKLASSLESMLKENNFLLEGAQLQRDNA